MKMDRVLFYGGEFGYGFSNFSAFAVMWNDNFYMTSEHVYQSEKFDDEDVKFAIMSALSAHDAYKIARANLALVRPTWPVEKIEVMRSIITAKHEQHPIIQEHLRESGSAELIENSEKDSFWGRGPDWKGKNHLGKLWMELRMERYGT